MVVEAWTAIVEELMKRGVRAPDLLVFTLTYWDLRLKAAEPIPGRLSQSLETVARCLGRPLPPLEHDAFARAAPPLAEQLMEELRGLRPKLSDLPGVSSIGELLLLDPATLVSDVRRFQELNGKTLRLNG